MTTYRIGWARDGHGEKTLDSELDQKEAHAWLESKSRQANQPILHGPEEGSFFVNESAEENCGFYFMTPEDSGLA